MGKEIIKNFRYASTLLQIRDMAIEPMMSEQFNKLIIIIREKLYKFIQENNVESYKGYIISLEIPTIIDYIFCVYDNKDTYPCEKIIERYGYDIKDLLDEKIFKYILE